LLRAGEPFTKATLERAYVTRRRASWVEREGRIAEHARDGFQRGVVSGLIGMALAGLTGGRLALRSTPQRPHERVRSVEEHFAGRIDVAEIARLRRECAATGAGLHDTLMDRCGWPPVPHDGQLLVSHQDALLLGGKVQAPAGYADHVAFTDASLCRECGARLCIDMCSGQALTNTEDGVPAFDREKCVHCGACYWNCTRPLPGQPDRPNLEFRAGTGGLHSTEN
jgi:electron-transferring-flavoprotein dehydrogenase